MKSLTILLLGALVSLTSCNEASVYLFITDGIDTIYYQAISSTYSNSTQVDFLSPTASSVTTNLS